MDIRKILGTDELEKWYEFVIDPNCHAILESLCTRSVGLKPFIQSVTIGFSGADGYWRGGQLYIFWDEDGSIWVESGIQDDPVYDDCLKEFTDLLLTLPSPLIFTPYECRELLDQLGYYNYIELNCLGIEQVTLTATTEKVN